MPEVKKATLKVTLSKEVNSCLAEETGFEGGEGCRRRQRYWTFLSGELPDGEEVIDFYHAAGTSTRLWRLPMATPIRSAVPSSRNCDTCLWKTTRGVEKVIRSLVHLRDTYPRRKKIARELKYFRRNRHRMRYAVLKKQGSADRFRSHGGSVQDSSNPTLEEVRNALGRARRPSHSILPRSRADNRFERAWTLLAHTYKAEVTALDNVVPIRSWR